MSTVYENGFAIRELTNLSGYYVQTSCYVELNITGSLKFRKCCGINDISLPHPFDP